MKNIAYKKCFFTAKFILGCLNIIIIEGGSLLLGFGEACLHVPKLVSAGLPFSYRIVQENSPQSKNIYFFPWFREPPCTRTAWFMLSVAEVHAGPDL